ncbi:MAG: NAD+ synthase [Gammaproteobacteria bacterium]
MRKSTMVPGPSGAQSSECEAILSAARQAVAAGADIVVFSELSLVGYPPEDLLFRTDLRPAVERALVRLCDARLAIDIVLGYPEVSSVGIYNAACVIRHGERVANYRKQCLPNYEVFDEKRYFLPGDAPTVFDACGVRVAITICEDLWEAQPSQQVKALGADVMINLNASPYHLGKSMVRCAMVCARALEAGCGIAYVNRVGGQDELVFDGRSMAVNANGTVAFEGPHCESASWLLTYDVTLGQWFRPEESAGVDGVATGRRDAVPEIISPETVEGELYTVLVQGVRDYVNRNGFRGAVLGLSGGIDSALTLCVAVDALGADRVRAVMMPYHHTANESIVLAQGQAERLGVDFSIKPIASVVERFAELLCDDIDPEGHGVTQQNLQARVRGVILMALSNESGDIVLTTGNKSELAVGYSTLYGDMAGGFDPIKDVPKTMVYRLAEYRNQHDEVIPHRVLTRPPTAELAPGQQDSDNLPPYEVLDEILRYYVDGDCGVAEIIEKGFDEQTVLRVAQLVDRNEYKRRQAPIGVRVSQKGFGKDRRYPVTFSWRVRGVVSNDEHH